MDSAIEPTVEVRPPRRKRIGKMVAWLVGLAVFWLVLSCLVSTFAAGWTDLWDQIKDIWDANRPGTSSGALVLQTGSRRCFDRALVLRHPARGLPGAGRRSWPIIASYAVGVAMNGFLPANIGTFVTLLMFVAIIPGCTVGGAIAAYLVQKIFFIRRSGRSSTSTCF